jgi:hypothetical protein
VGRHSKRGEHPLLPEVVGSLPALHRPTTHLPPDDLEPEVFREICTGEDTGGVVSNLGHTVLGLVSWVLWLVWMIYLWFFIDSPFTDLWIAFVIWFVVFVITILGIPIMRRTSRNRVRG